MTITIVVAMSENGVIGRDGGLPWRLPADLRHFKKVTWGKPLIMGRKTHESIGRPLPQRENIVVSRNPGYSVPGCTVANSVEAALELAGDAPEVMVIGGAECYRQLLPRAGRIYLTRVHTEIHGDTFFPALNQTEWRQRERTDHPADAQNQFPYSFILLERVEAPGG